MGPNLLLALLSLLLAGSPYISQIEPINDYFQFRSVGNIRGGFEVFIITIGAGGFLFALFNMFLKKKNGSPYLALGALVLVTAFFYNEEHVPLPLNNTLFGGELFFAFVVSFVLGVTGLVVEWLVEKPH
ncbi:MAG: hypothetical protein L0387_32615 [Acidobacteria bacterium]|nr:hypothetical protein [Acidobacteriota bacterium]MCI0626337.1 hypothetical protein [Acidobacteriota bacterium]MCI0718522.1 hypothetical protein [Acidobacteriota bacterium]